MEKNKGEDPETSVGERFQMSGVLVTMNSIYVSSTSESLCANLCAIHLDVVKSRNIQFKVKERIDFDNDIFPNIAHTV